MHRRGMYLKAEFKHNELRRLFWGNIAAAITMALTAAAFYVLFHVIRPMPAVPGFSEELIGLVKACDDPGRLRDALLFFLQADQELLSDAYELIYLMIDFIAVTLLMVAVAYLAGISELRDLNRVWPRGSETAEAKAVETMKTSARGGISCGS